MKGGRQAKEAVALLLNEINTVAYSVRHAS